MVKGMPMPPFAYLFLEIPWPFPNVPEIMPLMTGADYTAYLFTITTWKKTQISKHTHNSQKTYQI